MAMAIMKGAKASQPVPRFLGGKDLDIQRETSVWFRSPKHNERGREQAASYGGTGPVWELTGLKFKIRKKNYTHHIVGIYGICLELSKGKKMEWSQYVWEITCWSWENTRISTELCPTFSPDMSLALRVHQIGLRAGRIPLT